MRRLNLHAIQLVSALLMTVVPYLFWQGQTFAQDLINRSVLITSSVPSAQTTETVNMTMATATNLGSIVFQYCTDPGRAGDPCSAPVGLGLSSVILTQQNGNTGFTIDSVDSTANKIVITRPVSPALLVPSTYVFSPITNPSSINQTTYVRISTYASTNGTGPLTDKGAVAFSTTQTFSVGAFIPPFVELCVGVTVAPDCSSTKGDSIDLGILSSQSTSTATSQYAAGTNDVDGYNTYLLGSTMTSGNNVIPSVSVPTPNRPSTSEFGLNLRRNNGPAIGADPTGAGTAVPAADYNSPDLFSFKTGSLISSSLLSTDFNRMTVSYVVNVNSGQAAGVYNTTLTYLATVDF